MCGIAGRYHYAAARAVDPEIIRAMTRSLAHRGPDDAGMHLDGPLGLGFRRLSIVDVDGGGQPMSDETGAVWSVCNGEIYNFPELRADLEARGHRFRTRCDAEVIVHGYREWGDGVLDRLNGMFGLAVWDAPRRRLLLARDAMGVKPLYYALDDGAVTFGSEIRAVLAARPGAVAVDPRALESLLRYRYVPAPRTIVQGVYKLAAGTRLVAGDGEARVERWYTTVPEPFHPPKTAGEARDELLALYRGAVRRQLQSDVPVGLLLSGGVDSGLLLALMNEFGSGWRTYTVGYGPSFDGDELPQAEETARLFGAKHVSLQLDEAEFERTLGEIAGHLEEPVATSSIVPMYHVSRRAREDVKVVLSGQGPDELFGGYTRHLGVRYGAHWRRLPGPLRRAAEVAARLPGSATLDRGVSALGVAERGRRHARVFALEPDARVASLFREPPGGPEVPDLWREIEGLTGRVDDLTAFQMVEVRSALPDELLLFNDKMSMAHGLEARVPFLDREVVEYAERLPASLKVRRGRGKWLHRRVCRAYLPPALLRRKKRGFATDVVNAWFRRPQGSPLADLLRDGDSLLYRTLRRDAVVALLDAHVAGRNHYKILFALVCLEAWLRGAGSGGAAGKGEPAAPVASGR